MQAYHPFFYESRAKNTHFSTYTRHISYTSSVYAGCSTTTRVHRDLCQKIQKWSWVSMSRQEIYDPWLSTYWKHSESTLQFHLKAINGPIPRYEKEEKEFNFERKVTLQKLFTSYWVYIPLSFKSEHIVQPPRSSLIWWRTSLSLLYELAFSGGLKCWRPSWKELSFSIPNRADTELCINRNTLFSSNWYLANIWIIIPWVYLLWMLMDYVIWMW